jgi:hypothetical protein
MNHEQILKASAGTVFYQSPDSILDHYEHVVAGDLMSDILTVELDHVLLVTSLATEQVVRTADFVGARGILLVNGKKASESLLKLATQGGITILGTSLRMFEACCALGNITKDQ